MIRLDLSEDLSQIDLQFSGRPDLQMDLDSSVTFGPQIPVPLNMSLQTAVRTACDDWIMRHLVAPEVFTLKIDRLRRKSTLTDDDVISAIEAAKEAVRRAS